MNPCSLTPEPVLWPPSCTPLGGGGGDLPRPFSAEPPTCDCAEPGCQGSKLQSLVVAFQADLQLSQLVENPELGSHGLHPPR